MTQIFVSRIKASFDGGNAHFKLAETPPGQRKARLAGSGSKPTPPSALLDQGTPPAGGTQLTLS
jgi:hypothetical protein